VFDWSSSGFRHVGCDELRDRQSTEQEVAAMQVFSFRWLVMAGLAGMLILGGAPVSSGATRTVGASGADYTTIQDAIDNAVDGDIISIIDAVHTENGITVDIDCTIQGQGAGSTTLQGATSRQSAAERILKIGGNAVYDNVTIKDMTLKWGYEASTEGGAIFIVKANVAVQDCVFYQNDVGAGRDGGAVYVTGANVSSPTTTVTVRRCTFEDNSAGDQGGAVLVIGHAVLDLADSAFTGNTSGSAGGAININANNNATPCRIVNSTFYNNTAGTYAGAIYTVASTVESLVAHCTFVSNSAADYGGAVRFNAGQWEMNSCVFAGSSIDSGVAVRGISWRDQSAVMDVKACVWEGREAGNSADYDAWTIANGDTVGAGNAGLAAAPADNGGPTETVALLDGSICIGNGLNPEGLDYDQRGDPYERDNPEGSPDIGAYEFGAGVASSPPGTVVVIK
jgi:hypothetical protein